MADKTTGKLKLWLAKITDKISDTIVTYLPENFTKIDTEFSSLKDEVTAHKAEKATQSGGVHGLEIESGTWTPVFIGSLVAGQHIYEEQIGRYIRNGKLVYITGRIRLTQKDDAISGSLRISGLPFAGHSAVRGGGGVGWATNLGNNPLSTSIAVDYLRVAIHGVLDTGVGILENNSWITFSMTYEIA